MMKVKSNRRSSKTVDHKYNNRSNNSKNVKI